MHRHKGRNHKIDSRVHQHPLNVYALRFVEHFFRFRLPIERQPRCWLCDQINTVWRSIDAFPLTVSTSIAISRRSFIIAPKCCANKRFHGDKANKFELIVEPLDYTTFFFSLQPTTLHVCWLVFPNVFISDIRAFFHYQKHSSKHSQGPIERHLIYVLWKLIWWMVNGSDRGITVDESYKWNIYDQPTLDW